MFKIIDVIISDLAIDTPKTQLPIHTPHNFFVLWIKEHKQSKAIEHLHNSHASKYCKSTKQFSIDII